MTEEIKFKSCKKKNLRLRKKSSDDDEDQDQVESSWVNFNGTEFKSVIFQYWILIDCYDFL